MFELLFFTTNQTKIAHARYMAEPWPINIKSFREKTYHRSYTEPRLKDRDDLLRKSYESAIKQAKKGHVDPTKRFFFFEDTSVIVEALSSAGNEVPGVDVKYWMRDNDFSSIDAQLKATGKNRKAVVRSDVILHVPDWYRKKLKISEPYLQFSSSTQGSIITEEIDIQDNLIFPWLDSRTFNKWFVPDGCVVPLSRLPIAEADKHDFRRDAFKKMFDFLTSLGVLAPEPMQTELDLAAPLIIMCGQTCAGKTTASQFLSMESGILHVEASDFMYFSYYKRHGYGSPVKVGNFAEAALAVKPTIAVDEIITYLKTIPQMPTVISGFRSEKEVEAALKYFSPLREVRLGYIDASAKIRFERMKARKRDGEVTPVKFQEREDQEIRMGVLNIRPMAQIIPIANESSKAEFYKEIKSKLVPDLAVRSSSFAIDWDRLKKLDKDIGFEEAIILTLASIWSPDEGRDYKTTTQIAKMSGEVFPLLTPKQKDNVSRHFNRDVYLFYEAKLGEDGKLRYRLNNTGYGKAMLLYADLLNSLLI